MSEFMSSGMPPFLEDFTRRLLQGAFDRTKDPLPGGIPKQQIVGMQPLQTGTIAEMAKSFGLDPTTGQRTGAASFEPAFKEAQDAVRAGVQTTTMGIPSLQAAQAQFDPSTSNYQQFFDQYQKDVTNEALKQMDEQAAIAQQNLATQAQKVWCFWWI
jgi:hypothetical protein